MKKTVIALCLLVGAAGLCLFWQQDREQQAVSHQVIKWVDFQVTAEAMQCAADWQIQNRELDWISLLAGAATKYGGDFDKYKKADLDQIAQKALEGVSPREQTGELAKYYDYYYEAYAAVLQEFLGEYTLENEAGEQEEHFGVKAFCPIAKGYDFSHYDDFGTGRNYGFARKHLGHDLLGSIGTPIVAVESGTVEAIGWNQYGGWRIGIRSFDQKRYYYYAHMRKNHPYHYQLKEGDVVAAGEVIGYLGMTGYSTKENVNNINVPHLHWGMQLIFDESQKDAVSEIWIDCYQITKFLSQNRSAVVQDPGSLDYFRAVPFDEPSLEGRELKNKQDVLIINDK